MSSRVPQGVALPPGRTGSSFFHHVLSEAVARFPAALGRAQLPSDPRAFKRRYGEALVRFEAERAASPERVAIARFIARRTQEQLLYRDEQGSRILTEHLAEPPSPAQAGRLEGAELWRHELGGEPGFTPEVPFEGRLYTRGALLELAERLEGKGQLTRAAVEALRFVVEYAEERDGRIDLRGQRFVLLGAGAELAPTAMLLRAGADVLWVDITAPERVLTTQAQPLAGSLSYAPGADDVLHRPREVAATIARFADAGPVHIGMFAYAAGASQEWRLGAAMNAITRSLEPSLVQSVSLFISPTTVAHVQPEDADAAALRFRDRTRWQNALMHVGLLPRKAHHQVDGATVARAVVSIQGASYQAAQYISKICAAESYAVYGLELAGEDKHPVTVSANVAGITRTRSLSHPVFQAAFLGAPSFGVQIFDSETTRAFAGLLFLHDLLNPQALGSKNRSGEARDKVRPLLSQQVHGGIYSLPFVLEPAIRVAAVLGASRQPTILRGR